MSAEKKEKERFSPKFNQGGRDPEKNLIPMRTYSDVNHGDKYNRGMSKQDRRYHDQLSAEASGVAYVPKKERGMIILSGNSETKICKVCEQEKNLGYYRKTKTGALGHTCVECINKKRRETTGNKKFPI